ncbi:MAG: NPP1 family protein [Arenimonas sp.]
MITHNPGRSTKMLASLFALTLTLSSAAQAGAPFLKLDEAADATTKQSFAGVFDFDTDSCLPSPGVSSTGLKNGGLYPINGVTSKCRESAQLGNSNTYYRRLCVDNTHCVHMSALYFLKDQIAAGPGAHRHDWEFGLVWTTNGVITDASYSHHGDVTTESVKGLDAYQNGRVRFVYHKDGGLSHAMRFAKKDEKPENSTGMWFTPTIVDWYLMKGTGAGNDNAGLRKKINGFDYDQANCSFDDGNFIKEIQKSIPANYPAKQAWVDAYKAHQ